jgi:hypothetical protein
MMSERPSKPEPVTVIPGSVVNSCWTSGPSPGTGRRLRQWVVGSSRPVGTGRLRPDSWGESGSRWQGAAPRGGECIDGG